ncbi:protein of unknown function [Xenorhabdus doucetiae]|uniref:Uncharacterized protein n=1 Tax=Xenorhabdus doucetiae TaxID=351671 RepID=A0A068QS52_9GAMM|nr:protein of unknown function [Xenorhabdus doucetiae]
MFFNINNLYRKKNSILIFSIGKLHHESSLYCIIKNAIQAWIA